jgi:hypothetical protein
MHRTICLKVVAHDDGSVVIEQTEGLSTVCANAGQAKHTFAKLLDLYAPALRCDCHALEAGEGAAWLAAYGLFAREQFERWKAGERRIHHPTCKKSWS